MFKYTLKLFLKDELNRVCPEPYVTRTMVSNTKKWGLNHWSLSSDNCSYYPCTGLRWEETSKRHEEGVATGTASVYLEFSTGALLLEYSFTYRKKTREKDICQGGVCLPH